MATVLDLPHEVLSAICSVIYEAAFSTYVQPLDPLLPPDAEPTAQPSTYPPSNWSEPLSRTTLKNLCLVSHGWYNAAKPYIWRNVEIRLPRTWLAFVEEVGVIENEEEADKLVDTSVRQAASVALATKSDHHSTDLLQQSILAQLYIDPHNSVPPELLSPPASRDPSPARLRAKSPGRWRFLRAVSDLAQQLEPGVYVPTPDDPRPGRHVRHLDFNHFRTIGMRRSVGEGVNSRFVTASRVEQVLKEMPHLREFGATEYMDGALDKSVLVELLLRGRALSYSLRRGKGKDSRGRGIRGDVSEGTQQPVDHDDDIDRRLDCKDVEALDLCGCVSSVFVQAVTDFVTEYLEDEVADDGSIHPSPLIFPGLKRLGMRGVTSVPQHIITPFVLACTSLTHLDLSGTRVGPELLDALGDSTTVHLTALSLGRCVRLTADSIVDFLIHGLPTRNLRHLSLYGDGTFISPLSELHLRRLITEAPCFLSGALEYLDLSSSPLTSDLLRLFSSQSSLRSLGLSYIPALPLRVISDFVLEKAPNVEVLALIGTSPELGLHVPWRQLSMSLHSTIINPLATAPFKFSLSPTPEVAPPPTRVRVIELGLGALNALGAGAGNWRVIRSKGGRGWYVDSSSGWVNGELRRSLPGDHPIRKELERLAASNGNVSTGVGWHARKMEVLHGHGMLGREDGLYGAVSFAYQG